MHRSHAAARWSFFVFVGILALSAGLILPAPSAQAQALGEGVEGWCHTVPFGEGADCFDTPAEACDDGIAQIETVQPNTIPDGLVYDDGNNAAFVCKWRKYIANNTWFHGFFLVSFRCETGYRYAPPWQCIKIEDDTRNPPICNPDSGRPNPTVGNPIEAFSGRKIDSALDFATEDGLLYVARSYSSRVGSVGVLPSRTLRGGGAGWTFDFGPTLKFRSNFAGTTNPSAFFLPDGTEVGLSWNSSTDTIDVEAVYRERFVFTYVGVEPLTRQLINAQSTQWQLVDKLTGRTHQMQTFLRPGESTYMFGYATEIENREGYEWTISYGAESQITQIQDSFGRTLSFEWLTGTAWTGVNLPILISQITLPDGTALRYTYEPSSIDITLPIPTELDRMSKAEHVADPNLQGPSNVISSTTYHYEDQRFPAHLTGVTDARGVRYATWTYDARGRAVSSSLGQGVETYELAYSEPSSTSWTRTVTNPLGRQTVYTFTKNGSYWLPAQVDGLASANCVASNSSYTYLNGRVATFTNEEGYVTEYVRDANGLPIEITEAAGSPEERITELEWTADRQIELREIPGLSTEFVYGLGGRVDSVTQTDTTSHTVPYSTNGQTRTWAYTYTTAGRIETVDGPLPGTGDTITYAYDASGNLASVTDQLGHVTTITIVDGLGRPLEVQDPNGIYIEFTYTPEGYLETTTVDPSGANVSTTMTYNAVGQVALISRSDGSEFTYTYDDARRLISVTDAKGNVMTYVRDDMGNVEQTQILNPSMTVLRSQSATFDELGRQLSAIGAGGEAWTYAYDKVSNLVSITDPRSGEIAQAFNGLRELIETVDQGNNTIGLTRDDQGQIFAYEDPRSIDTTYVRNGWGEVIQESSPDIGTVVYERNQLGLITKKTDARSIIAEYAYDDAGRLTSVTYPSAPAENVTFTYDSTTGGNLGIGRLSGFTDPVGTTAITYNSLGLVASESLTLLGSTATTEYVYDSSGNLFYIVYPSGRRISYWRDAEGEINSVASRQTASAPLVDIATDIVWQPYGEVKEMTFQNGLSLWRTFDQNYRDQQLGLYDGQTALMSRYYAYLDDLNLTNIWDNVDSSDDQEYWYSSTNQLRNADGPWGENTYYQDGSQNLTWQINDLGGVLTEDQMNYPGGSNRLSSIWRNGSALRTFTHDPAGNILTDVRGGVTTQYTYNHADRLASFTRDGIQRGQYTYNARGQLVVRTVTNSANNGTTVYFYDLEGHVIAEFDGATAALKREYVWLGDRPIAITDPSPSGDEIYYIHADHLNRPIAVTDDTKAFVAQFTWLPFGGLHSYSGTVGLDLRFPGQLFQAESGLHYNWNRQYDPTTGRYTQPDPLGLVDGPSRFAYALNNPLQLTDPTGEVVLPPTLWMNPAPPDSGSGAGMCPVDSPSGDCRTISGKVVPVGTIAYRPVDTPSRPQHGIVGPHYNLYRANKNPNNGQCFWQSIGAVPAGALPLGAIPIEPFAN